MYLTFTLYLLNTKNFLRKFAFCFGQKISFKFSLDMSSILKMMIMMFLIIPLDAIQSMNALNGIAFRDVVSVFNFLPKQQFSQLRLKIYDILQNRQSITSKINPKSIYTEAASIVSEIQNAYASVVSFQLQKRDIKKDHHQETGFSGIPHNGDKSRATKQLYDDNHIKVLGLFDIFDNEEKAKVESALNLIRANHDFGIF